MAKITEHITATRGDTIFSPTWFILVEDLPPNVTYQEIVTGIANGTYTPVDLTAYEIKGQVRATPQGTVVLDLPLVVTDDYKLSFTIPAEITAAFTNENQSYGYDIQFKTIADGTVKTWIAGKLTITTDYTYTE